MKIGKTTLAVQFPKPLLLAAEKGYNNIDGVFVADIPTWAEFKAYVKQLKEPENQENFHTIIIDTVGELYARCTSYICDREGVDSLAQAAFGKAYKLLDDEFESTLRKLQSYGYGIVFIGHSKEKTDSDGTISITNITPDLPDRCAKIINRMVDLTAYLGFDSNKKRCIYPRQTTIDNGLGKTEIYAGSHFGCLNDKIDLSYEALSKAIADAMEKEAKNRGAKLTDAPVAPPIEAPKLDYKAIKTDIIKYVKLLNSFDEKEETPHYMDDYKTIVAKYLGKGKLVKDCDESQAEHLNLILDDLKDYFEVNNLLV